MADKSGKSGEDAGRLSTYQRKRDFERTPEPAGGSVSTPGGALRFVVQRHRARRLHYDLRLEIDGVLVSWAVPKGPTLDPGVRRMAVHVEDHPMEYVDFEGVIPSGEYGGGDVIVWDSGTWEPHGPHDPAAAVAAGEVHAEMYGEKLRGRLVLVRTDDKGTGQEQWLLLHKHDDHAVDGWSPEEHPRSVLSGRTNDEVKADPDRLWRSDLPAAEASIALKPGPVEPPDEEALSALAPLDSAGRWEVFGRELRLTKLDRALFPAAPGEDPVTKRELIRYAALVAPVLLPYLHGRALTMHRFPNGADRKGSWVRRLPGRAPDWLPRWKDLDGSDSEGTRTRLVVNEPAALVWAANFGALEWHPWTSRVDEPGQPTYALFDIDPGADTSWQDVLTLARLHRTALEHLGLRAYPKLAGSRGIHVWVPIRRGPTFDETRAWVEQVSRSIADVVPELVGWQWSGSERGGRARLDYTHNAIGKTLVAPYSPGASAGAPVSLPIEWDELDDPSLRPDGWTLRTALDRIEQRGDVFSGVLTTDQTLPRLET